nr:MAG TPA: hypothetical protein [Bacteriophage sp.]
MGHNNRIGYGNGSDSGTRFGIEIFSEGYKSAIRIYQNGKDVSDLYRDEVQYVNQRIAMVVSRYREMYRYQIMMSSTYGGGYIVEFNANQIRDIGFDGIDLVYSDLESLSILFSEELNGVIDIVLDAYVYSRTCNDVCGVLSQYVDDSDRAYWVELLDKVVNDIADILGRFYVYYVGLLTNRDVIEYMLQRYDKGLVVGRYHNELAIGILHMRIDIELYRIQDVDVDIAHTYWIDAGDEYVGGYRVIWDSIMKNAYYLPLVTKGSAKGLCDVLEMIAYVNDAMLGYYQDNQIDLVRGDLCKSDRYQSVAESFLDVVLNRVDITDYYDCDGIVFNYDNNTDIIEMFIPIEKLSTKMMASRVFNVGRFVDYYLGMLIECAERFKKVRYD